MPGAPDGPGSGGPRGGWLGPGNPLHPDAPTTEGGAAGPEPTAWTRWWKYNRDPYLQLGTILAGRESSSGGEGGRAGLTESKVRGEVVPAILAALTQGGDLPLVRECLMALARIGQEDLSPGVGLDFYAKYYLKGDYPELQEAAVIALGVAGQASSVPLLRAIVDNTEEGRALTDMESVPVRLRAFAAYGLGLLGAGSPDQALRLAVVHSLLDSLGNERTATREIQVACVLAAGLVDLEFCADDPVKLLAHEMEGDRHLCGGIQLLYLLDIFRDDGLDPWVRAHAAPAIGRLGRVSPLDFRTAVLEELSGALAPRSGEPEYVRQGCVIGLGLFADGDEDQIDVQARQVLAGAAKKGDALSQRFALISLARAAARPGDGENKGKGLEKARGVLLAELSRGREDRKAWAALALGVLGHERMEAREVVSEDVTGALRHALSRCKDPAQAAALVLGLGILRDPESPAAVLAAFDKIEDSDFRACAALTLGIVHAREGIEPVKAAFLGEDCDVQSLRPDVALGLRLLGDSQVMASLLERLAKAEKPEDRAAVVRFLGALDDPRGVGVLIATTKDGDEKALVRTAAINALGRMCDRSRLPWTSAYAADIQYDLLTWTLSSPFGDATGLLDWR